MNKLSYGNLRLLQNWPSVSIKALIVVGKRNADRILGQRLAQYIGLVDVS